MDAATAVGTAAAFCSVTSFLPQAWKIVRTRDTSAISAPMYALTVIGFSLWVGYGVLLGAWPIILPNSICFVLSAFILAMKLMPQRKREEVADAVESIVK